MWILFTGENLRALGFTSSEVFLKCPPGHCNTKSSWWQLCCCPLCKSHRLQCHHHDELMSLLSHSAIFYYWGHIPVNTLRPRQNGRHFADDIFKWIFLNENVWIPIKISLKFVPQGPINNIPALVQIMAWRQPGDKPLSGPMMVRLPTHICVTRPQWVNENTPPFFPKCRITFLD